MDVLEYAMKMEMDGKAFYEKGAAEAESPEIKKVLTTLAEEEQKHYLIFKSLKANADDQATQAMTETGTPALARNVFQKLADSGTDTLYGDEQQKLWKEAIKIEEESEKLYRDAAAEENNEARRDLLNRIADEEKNHIYLIHNMIAFMRDPKGFVDSAQFKNFMSWEGH